MMTKKKVEELIKVEEIILKKELNVHVNSDFYLKVLKSHLEALKKNMMLKKESRELKTKLKDAIEEASYYDGYNS